MLIDENGSVIGDSSGFGMFSKIPSIPVVDREEEFQKYVFTEKGDSPAAIEMVHWHAFKSPVDAAWKYIHGVRHYQTDLEEIENKNPLNKIIWVVIGLAVMSAGALLISKFWG